MDKKVVTKNWWSILVAIFKWPWNRQGGGEFERVPVYEPADVTEIELLFANSHKIKYTVDPSVPEADGLEEWAKSKDDVMTFNMGDGATYIRRADVISVSVRTKTIQTLVTEEG